MSKKRLLLTCVQITGFLSIIISYMLDNNREQLPVAFAFLVFSILLSLVIDYI